MDNSLLKSSDSSSRVALLLRELINRPLDYDDIIKLFDEKKKKPVYTKVALSKYINTLRTLGLQIKRSEKKYTLLTFLYQIVLTDKEVQAFNNLETTVLKYGTRKEMSIYYNLKVKILKFFDAESQKKLSNYVQRCLVTKLGVKINTFGKFCDDGQNIKIRYKGEIFTVEPRQILFIDNDVYFECIDVKNLKIRKLLLEKVTFIKLLPQKNKNKLFSNSVIYEITDRLARNYKLKEGETSLVEEENRKVIKVEKEDYELLAKRLIRYKNYCKILQPVEFQKYFENFTDKILSLYEN
ncbi:hypothetical protein IJS77_02505 [bacterium]|nr:hypothetical protein [bacterium]